MRHHTALTGLEDWAAEKLLDKQGVEQALWPRILPLAKGNPLLLKLAGRALSQRSVAVADLPADVSGIGSYLYRAMLARLPSDLREIANLGLILPSINKTVLENVISPALGLALDAVGSQAAIAALRAHDWLVAPTADGGLRHRRDIRAAFLQQIYADEPKQTAAINAVAADWFTQRDPVLALYHRLQLVRSGGKLPTISPAEASSVTPALLADLPARSRDQVLQAQGQRSGFARIGDGPARPGPDDAAPPADGCMAWSERLDRIMFDPPGSPRSPDPRAIKDLTMSIERNDAAEAAFIVSRAFEAPFPFDSNAALLVMCQQWQAGRWDSVDHLYKHLGFKRVLNAVVDDNHPPARLLLEIAAEFDFDATVEALQTRDLANVVNTLVHSPPPTPQRPAHWILHFWSPWACLHWGKRQTAFWGQSPITLAGLRQTPQSSPGAGPICCANRLALILSIAGISRRPQFCPSTLMGRSSPTGSPHCHWQRMRSHGLISATWPRFLRRG
uniref:Uncharacterized protein n=1 Tax=Yoonia rhodophyticola TaxID=3137370 RepID=A0AAN0MBP2_9RHOB